MPINVSIKTRPGRKDYAFTWVATSDEARSLWDRCEEMATEQGHEAHEIASGVIQQFYKEGEPKSENERRVKGAKMSSVMSRAYRRDAIRRECFQR
jgi:hypothetical protein